MRDTHTENWKQKYQMVCDEMQALVTRYSDARSWEREAIKWEREASGLKVELSNRESEVRSLRYRIEKSEEALLYWKDMSKRYRIALFTSAISVLILAYLFLSHVL